MSCKIVRGSCGRRYLQPPEDPVPCVVWDSTPSYEYGPAPSLHSHPASIITYNHIPPMINSCHGPPSSTSSSSWISSSSRRCCSPAYCAILLTTILILAALLSIIGVSVYLGIITNLSRTTILPVSGKFPVKSDHSVSQLYNLSSPESPEKSIKYNASSPARKTISTTTTSTTPRPRTRAAPISTRRPFGASSTLLTTGRTYSTPKPTRRTSRTPYTPRSTTVSFDVFTVKPSRRPSTISTTILSTIRSSTSTTPKPTRRTTRTPISHIPNATSGSFDEFTLRPARRPSESPVSERPRTTTTKNPDPITRRTSARRPEVKPNRRTVSTSTVASLSVEGTAVPVPPNHKPPPGTAIKVTFLDSGHWRPLSPFIPNNRLERPTVVSKKFPKLPKAPTGHSQPGNPININRMANIRYPEPLNHLAVDSIHRSSLPIDARKYIGTGSYKLH